MSKGIAIRTILLLLVGVLIAGILIYLVYTQTSGVTMSIGECNSRLTSICMTCKGAGWGDWPSRAGDPAFFTVIDECASYADFSSFSCGGTCDDCSDLQNPCKTLGVG